MAAIDWALVEEGLAKINERLGVRFDYPRMAELIDSGKLIYFKHPTTDWFVLIEPSYPYSGGAFLNVVAGYSREHNRAAREDIVELILAYARENGFDGMTFSSTRPGWARAFPEAGKQTMYELRV